MMCAFVIKKLFEIVGLPIFTNLIASYIVSNYKSFGYKSSTKLDDIIHNTFVKVIDENVRNRSIAKSMKLNEESAFKELLEKELKLCDSDNINSIKDTCLFAKFKEELYTNPSFAFHFLIVNGIKCSRQSEQKENLLKETIKRLKENDATLKSIIDKLTDMGNRQKFAKPIEISGIDDDQFCPLVDSFSKRDVEVSSIVTELLNNKIIYIYGSVYSGKSVLACLVAKKMDVHRKVRITFNYQDVYNPHNILKNFEKEDSILFIFDDVPYNDKTSVEEFHKMVNLYISQTNWYFIVTGRTKMSERVLDPTLRFNEILCENLSVDNVKEIGCKFGFDAMTSELVYVNTGGQPYLTFLFFSINGNHKIIDKSFVEKCFGFSNDVNTQRKIQCLFDEILGDAEDYHLLNRLSTVLDEFTEQEVISLASLSPAISNPEQRFLHLIGPFVEKNGDKYKMSDLVKKTYKPDLTFVEKQSCYKLLAENVKTNNQSITVAEILKKILYYVQADCFDEAACYYMNSLAKLPQDYIKYIKSNPSVALLTSLWIDVNLPDKMGINTKLLIRIAQLIYINNISEEQKDFIVNNILYCISNKKNDEEIIFQVIQMAETILTLNGHFAESQKISVFIESHKLLPLNEEVNLPKESIWISLRAVKSFDELFEWYKLFEQKGKPDFDYAEEFAYNLIRKLTKEYNTIEFYDIYDKIKTTFGDDSEFAISLSALQIHSCDTISEAEKIYSERYLRDNDFCKVVMNYALYSVCNKFCDKTKEEKLLQQVVEVKNLKLRCMTSLYATVLLSKILYEKNDANFILPLKQLVSNVNIDEYYAKSEIVKCYGEYAISLWLSGDVQGAISYLVKVENILWGLRCGINNDIKETTVKLSAALVQFYRFITKGAYDRNEIVPSIGLFISDSPKLVPEYGYFRYFSNSFYLYKIADLRRFTKNKLYDSVYNHIIETSTSSLNEHDEFSTLLLEIYYRSLYDDNFEEAIYILKVTASSFYKEQSTKSHIIDAVLLNSLVFLLIFVQMGNESDRDDMLQQVISFVNTFNSYSDEKYRIDSIVDSIISPSNEMKHNDKLNLIKQIQASKQYRNVAVLIYIDNLYSLEAPLISSNYICKCFIEKYLCYYLKNNIYTFPLDYCHKEECIEKLNKLVNSDVSDFHMRIMKLMYYYMKDTDGLPTYLEDKILS